jgi:hypothetical protein
VKTIRKERERDGGCWIYSGMLVSWFALLSGFFASWLSVLWFLLLALGFGCVVPPSPVLAHFVALR